MFQVMDLLYSFPAGIFLLVTGPNHPLFTQCRRECEGNKPVQGLVQESHNLGIQHGSSWRLLRECH